MLLRRGQSILEYTIIVGIITVVLFYLGTGVKRGVQSLIKVTADQVGNQVNSDQDFNDTQQGYMVASNTQTQFYKARETKEIGDNSAGVNYDSNVSYNESTDTQTNTITNGGFTQSS